MGAVGDGKVGGDALRGEDEEAGFGWRYRVVRGGGPVTARRCHNVAAAAGRAACAAESGAAAASVVAAAACAGWVWAGKRACICRGGKRGRGDSEREERRSVRQR